MSRRLLSALVLGATAIATPASAEWREASTEHFLIYADAPEDWTRAFADRLERFDSAMRVLRPLPERDGARANRVTVYVLPDMDALQALANPNGASQAAGFYIPRSASVAFVARTVGSSRTNITSDTILFHEYTHHLMWNSAQASYPRWLSEGFAEFNGAALIGNDGRVEIGRPAYHRQHSLMSTESIPIEQLIDGRGTMNQDLFYGRAWLLTHMLFFDPARKGQLDAYMKLIVAGKPNLEAAREAFGDLKKLNRDIDDYMGKPFGVVTIPAAKVRTGPIAMRALTPGEAAMMPVRLRSQRGVDKALAERVVIDARRRAAPFPNDPAVQSALAEAEFDVGNYDAADAAADRALAADPRNVDALMYKGDVAIRRATDAKSTDAATWRAARAWYIKAAAARPDYAVPLARFYDSFTAQGAAPTANASAALQKAFYLAPQDRTLRYRAARQLLVEEKPKEARAALVPLAFDPHGGTNAAFAQRLVKMIDDGVAPAKIAAEKPGGAAAKGPD